MSARTIRRAIQRKMLKETLKAQDATGDALFAEEHPFLKTTLARIEANRANAQLSTGPKSDAGKATSSLNAVKTGLTGRTVVLASDDAARYEEHVRRYAAQFKAVGGRESEVVQMLADTQWRLNRIPSLEAGIYALARIEFAPKFAEYEPAEASALIQAQAFITYHKQLNNLTIQETRLRRQFSKDLAELTKLQKERAEQEPAEPRITLCPPPAPEFANGFEFSTDSLDALEDHLKLDRADRNLSKAA